MLHTKLIILGRDGILNRYREDHVKAPAEWVAIDGALEAVSRLNHGGWHTVVATNQAGIGRGVMDMASINAIHAEMNRQLMEEGARLDAVFFCPHTPEEGCDCRKPLPGMMRDIGRRYAVDLAEVHMVTDTLRDLLAAQAAGCQPHLVRSGRAAALTPEQLLDICRQVPGTQIHASLGAFADTLLADEAEGAAVTPVVTSGVSLGATAGATSGGTSGATSGGTSSGTSGGTSGAAAGEAVEGKAGGHANGMPVGAPGAAARPARGA